MKFTEFTKLSPEEAEEYVNGISDESILLDLAADGIEDLKKLAEVHSGTPLGDILNDFIRVTEKEFEALKEFNKNLDESSN